MVKRKHSRKHTRKHSRKHSGGGYTLGQAVAPEAPYSQEIIGGPKLTPDCLAATRPGMVTPITGSGGLPGFAGGRRMKGGRYTMSLDQGPLATSGPSLGGYPVVSRIGCEGGLVNTSPPGALANPVPLQNGGVGGIDSAYYTAPTAGYDNRPSSWVDSVGAPVQLQLPYDARIMNPACLKTGGRRTRRYRSKRSKSKKTKSKRSNRK